MTSRNESLEREVARVERESLSAEDCIKAPRVHRVLWTLHTRRVKHFDDEPLQVVSRLYRWDIDGNGVATALLSRLGDQPIVVRTVALGRWSTKAEAQLRNQHVASLEWLQSLLRAAGWEPMLTERGCETLRWPAAWGTLLRRAPCPMVDFVNAAVSKREAGLSKG